MHYHNITIMSELMTNVSNDQLKGITSPEIIYIMTTIKRIQQRMKDPEIAKLEYIRVYDQLGKEFDAFFERYTGIFVKVIRGENLSTLASVLFYKDQVLRGLMTEEELADQLASKYLPANLKKESDAKLKEMKENKSL
jgi:hypothetical protein